MRELTLEVCVDSLESAENAVRAGADRLELCSELSVGGLTPSAGLIRQVREISSIDLNVLIRPRSGDFCFNKGELKIMQYDILLAKQLGADGVVIGALKEDGTIDTTAVKEMIKLVKPLSITFHRAFDLVSDPFKSLNQLIFMGVDRILTSGQASSALKGVGLIEELNSRSGGRIIIMPGAGVSEDNVAQIILATGVTEIHTSAKAEIANIIHSPSSQVSMGLSLESERKRYIVSTKRLKAILKKARQALNDS